MLPMELCSCKIANVFNVMQIECFERKYALSFGGIDMQKVVTMQEFPFVQFTCALKILRFMRLFTALSSIQYTSYSNWKQRQLFPPHTSSLQRRLVPNHKHSCM